MASIQEAVQVLGDEIIKLKRENSIHIRFIQDIAAVVKRDLPETALDVFEEQHRSFIENINRNRGV